MSVIDAAGAAALYEAERKGVRQVFGMTKDGDGRCAAQVLIDAHACGTVASWNARCPLCDAGCYSVVAHLNDAHRLSFSEIARKLGPDSV